MYRLPISILLAITMLLCYCTFSAGEEKTSSDQMKKKVEYSKNILEALVKEDFEGITKNAKALNKLGEQRWRDAESPEYRTQNQVFWFTSGALVMAGEQENMDGAVLAYTQLTMSCVNCHKILRRE